MVIPKFSDFIELHKTQTQNLELFQLIESILRPFFKDIPEDKSVLTHIIDTLNPRKPLPKDSYLFKTVW